MYSFENDYSEGAHQRIITALSRTNMEQTAGYGEDPYTKMAIDVLKQKMNCYDTGIYFLTEGHKQILLPSLRFLKPYEAVISANTGHIQVHETGAIESTGHKVLITDSKNGKITPTQIQSILDVHTDEHMVKPRLVIFQIRLR